MLLLQYSRNNLCNNICLSLCVRMCFRYFRLIEKETFFFTLSNANQKVTLVVTVTFKSLQCKYFDEATDTWETSGCAVLNSTVDTTICRCNRIAQFGVSEIPISTNLNFQNVPVSCDFHQP